MHQHISVSQRELIARWNAQGVSNKQIAQSLKVRPAMIGRELRRNRRSDGWYSAARNWYGEAPADYTTVHVYHRDPHVVSARFAAAPSGSTTLVVLKLPPFLPTRAETTSLAHTFVDLWNFPDWMAKDFVRRVREEIDEKIGVPLVVARNALRPHRVARN